MPAVLSATVVDVAAVVDKLVADDTLVADTDRLVGDAEELLAARTRLLAGLVRRLRAADAADAMPARAGRSTQAWLVEDQRLLPREASDLMLLVHHLGEFPATDAALAAGEITVDHAVRIVRGLLTLPEEWRELVEPHLLDWARKCPPGELKSLIRELLERLGLMEAREAAEQEAQAGRGVSIGSAFEGNRWISGSLTPDGGAIVEEALRQYGAGDTWGEGGDKRTTSQRDHDSLVGICRQWLASQGTLPSFAGSPAGVIVTIPLEVLEGRLSDQSALLLPAGIRIGPETARRLACDAQLIPVVLGSKGEILDIGRASRDFTEAMRRAQYFAQQGTCAFPGCKRRVADCHHIIWWSNNGKTCIENCAWLCQFHHWLVHEGNWTLHKHPDGSMTFTSRYGKTYTRHITAA